MRVHLDLMLACKIIFGFTDMNGENYRLPTVGTTEVAIAA
jgi:hypothetical protein